MMIMVTRNFKILCALMAGGMVISTPAFAEMRTIEVQTSDLNLSNASGQDRLQRRIENAVRQVCRSHIARNFGERQDIAKCEAEARVDAQAQVSQRIAEYRAKGTKIGSADMKIASD
jgi:UrcA family protein